MLHPAGEHTLSPTLSPKSLIVHFRSIASHTLMQTLLGVQLRHQGYSTVHGAEGNGCFRLVVWLFVGFESVRSLATVR